jgi:hypothetical protein
MNGDVMEQWQVGFPTPPWLTSSLLRCPKSAAAYTVRPPKTFVDVPVEWKDTEHGTACVQFRSRRKQVHTSGQAGERGGAHHVYTQAGGPGRVALNLGVRRSMAEPPSASSVSEMFCWPRMTSDKSAWAHRSRTDNTWSSSHPAS